MSVLGMALVGVPMTILFGMSVAAAGWKEGLLMWGFSIAMTASIATGVFLLLS